MLAILFSLGSNRYAIDSRSVMEIVPLPSLSVVPHAPECIAGQFNYRGAIVPVIDLRLLVEGKACVAELGTRIAIIHYGKHVLGLMAEKVTEARRLEEAKTMAAPVSSSDAPYVGRIMVEEQELIQFVKVEELLKPALRNVLFVNS
jgi:chemotaxis-related protein WspB